MQEKSHPVIRLQDMTKSYGRTLALKKVNFEVFAGEIHAVLGENGAGKSTLMKLISGVIQPTLGSLYMANEAVRFNHPKDAIDRGLICMFQELSLVPDLTVGENLRLAQASRGFSFFPKNNNKVVREILNEIDGGHIRFSQKISELTLPERQQVEIAKALSRNPKLLILDEATSALNASVVEKVFDLVRRERDKGTGVLFISHRFHEIEILADKISVFRSGEHVDTFKNGAYDYPTIINKMVGKPLGDLFPPKPSKPTAAKEVVSLENFGWNGEIKNISMRLNEGQILGLGGLDGQGQISVLNGLFGLLKKTDGQIKKDNEILNLKDPKQAKSSNIGIALVPEDRKTEGLILKQSIRDNMYLASLGFSKKDQPKAELFEELIEALALKCDSLDQGIEELSGGNQQKVSLIKWLALQPDVLLLADPTRGIDVNTKTRIYKMLRKLADEGVAIVLLSTDYEELINLCDEVHVFYDGQVVDVFTGNDLTPNNIIAASLNMKNEEQPHA